jgi:hypothetical protein
VAPLVQVLCDVCSSRAGAPGREHRELAMETPKSRERIRYRAAIAYRLAVLLALLRDAGPGAPAADLVGWPRDLFWDAPTQEDQKMAAGAALS